MIKKTALTGLLAFVCFSLGVHTTARADLIAAPNLVVAVADADGEIDLQWTTLASTNDHGTGDNTPWAFPRSAITYDVFRDTTNSFAGKTTEQIYADLADKLIASQIPQDQDEFGMPAEVYIFWSDYATTSFKTGNWTAPLNGVEYWYCIIAVDNEDIPAAKSNPSNRRSVIADSVGPNITAKDPSVPDDGSFIQTTSDLEVILSVTEAVALNNGNLVLNYKFDNIAILGAGATPNGTVPMTVSGTVPNLTVSAMLPLTLVTTQTNVHWWVTGTDAATGNPDEPSDLTAADGNPVTTSLTPAGQGITSDKAFDYTVHDDPAQLVVNSVTIVGTPAEIDVADAGGFTVRVNITNSSGAHNADIDFDAADLVFTVAGADKTAEFTVTPPANDTLIAGGAADYDYTVVQDGGVSVGDLEIDVDANMPAAEDAVSAWDASDADGATTPSTGTTIRGTIAIEVVDLAVADAAVDQEGVCVGYIDIHSIGENITANTLDVRVDTTADVLSDLSNLQLLLDNGNEVCEPAADALAAETGGAPLASETFTNITHPVLTAGEANAKRFWIVYDIAAAAVGGNTFRAQVDNGWVSGTGASTSLAITSDGTGDTTTLTTIRGSITFTGADIAPATAEIGETGVCVGSFEVYSTGENVSANTFDVQVDTTADLLADLSNLQLLRDDNDNGTCEPGTDPVAAQKGGTPLASELFTNITHPLLTAGAVNAQRYWVVYNVAAGAAGGNTFSAAVEAANVAGDGALSGLAIAAQGTDLATGAVTIYGTLATAAGTADQAPTGAARGSNNVQIARLVLSATGESVSNPVIDFSLAGSTSYTDVSAVKVYLNSTADNTLSEAEIAAGAIATRTNPNATDTITLTGETVATGTDKDYFIAVDVRSTAAVGNTIQIDIDASAGDITGTGAASGEAVATAAAPDIAAASFLVAGGLAMTSSDVAWDSGGRGASDILAGAIDITPSGENVNNLRVTVNTTAVNYANLTAVRIYSDDGDGEFDPGSDTLEASDVTVSASDTLDLSGFGALTAGTTYRFWIAYDIAAGAPIGNTFSTAVDPANVLADGVTSGVGDLVASGSVFTGSAITIAGRATLATVDITGGAGNVGAATQDLEMACIQIGAVDENINQVKITIQHTSTSLADIQRMKIYRSNNPADCVLDEPEKAAGALVTDTALTASKEYTLTGVSITAGASQYFIITYDLVSNATPNNTIDMRIAADAVKATGVTSGAVLQSAPGAATDMADQTIVGTLNIVATDMNPGQVPQGKENVPFIRVAITAYGENISLHNPNSVVITQSAVGDMANLKLYHDANSNGILDAGEAASPVDNIGSASPATFNASSQTINAGATAYYFIGGDINAAAPIDPGSDNAMTIADDAVQGVGAVTGATIVSSGTGVSSTAVEITGSVTGFTGTSAAQSWAAAGDTCVLLGEFEITIGGEALASPSLNVNTTASALSDLAGLYLFLDDGDGTLQSGTDCDGAGADDLIGVETSLSASMSISLTEDPMAIGTHTIFIAYGVSATAVGGNTFSTAIATTGLTGTGDTTSQPIASSGAAALNTSATPTRIYGAFTVDSAEIVTGFAAMGQTNVPKAWIEITAENESIVNPVLPLVVTGTALSADFSNMKIWRDTGSLPGQWDPGDVLVKTDTTVTIGLENQTLTGETVYVGSPKAYIVTFDISGTATPGRNFGVSMTANDVDGTGGGSGYAIDATPGGTNLATGTTDIVGTMVFTATDTATGALSVDGIHDLAFITLTAGAEEVNNNTVDISVALSATNFADVTSLQIYVDDGDLAFDSGVDTLVATVAAAGSPVDFTNLGIGAIAAGTSVDLWLAAVIPPTATTGNTLAASIAAADVQGDTGSGTVTASGSDFNGATQTISGQLNLTVADTSGAFGGITQPNVEMLAFKIESPDENVNTIQVTINTTGTTSIANVSSIKVYRDSDGDGNLSEAEINAGYIGTPINSPVMGNNTYHLTGQTILAGDDRDYVAVVDISSGAAIGNNIRLAIEEGGVRAYGVSSGATMTSSGTGSLANITVAGFLSLHGTDLASATVPVGQDKYVVGMITLGAVGETIGTVANPIEVTVETGGSVPLANLDLYIYADNNPRNGQLDAAELAAGPLVSVAAPIAGSQALTFPATETIGAGTTKDYLIVYDIAGGANVNTTLESVIDPDGATGGGASSGAVVTSGGASMTATASTVTESIAVTGYEADAGATVSIPASAESGSACVFAGRVTVEANGGGGAQNITGATMTVTTTATSLSDIAGLYIFREPDGGNGAFDATACANAGDDVALAGADPDTAVAASKSYSLGLLTHGETVTYYIAYELAPTAVGGNTFKAGVAVAAVSGAGAGTTFTITSTGTTPLAPATGTEIFGTMTAASDEIATAIAVLGQTNVAKAWIEITAGGEAINDPVIPIAVIGTVTAADFANMRIYRDTGTVPRNYDAGDTLVLTDATVTVGAPESQTLTGETIPAGSTVGYIITFDVASAAVIGRAWDVQVAADSITGTGAVTGETLTATFAALDTGDTTIVGGFTFAGTDIAVGSTSVSATDVPLISFIISSSDEAIAANSLDLDVELTVSALADIAAVTIYRGSVGGPLAQQVLTPGATTVSFTDITHPAIATGTPQTFFVTVDIDAAATVGNTLQAEIDPTTVTGDGADSGEELTATGTAVESSENVIAGTLSISSATDLAAGYNSIGAGVSDVAFAAFRLTAAHEAINDLAIEIDIVTAAASNVSVLKIYRDTNQNGVLDDAEIAAGPINELANPTGTDVIELTGQSVSAGATRYYIVALDIEAEANFGQTVGVDIAATAAAGTAATTGLAVTSVAGGSSVSSSTPSIGGSIEMANTSLAPTYLQVGGRNLPLTAITLTARGESMAIGSVDIAVALTGNNADIDVNVDNIKLYMDMNQNGKLDADELAEGPIITASPAGGGASETLTLNLPGMTLVMDTTYYFVITMDFEQTAVIGDYVKATINKVGSVTGTGQTSGLTIETFGEGFNTGNLYLREGLLLTASAPTGLPLTAVASQTNIAFAAIQLDAYGGTVSNVTFSPSVTATDIADIKRMKLYIDEAPYGALGTTELTAGAIATINNPSAEPTFTPTTAQNVTVGTPKYYIIAFDMADTATTNNTISILVPGSGAQGRNASLQTITSTGTSYQQVTLTTVIGTMAIVTEDVAPASASEGRDDVAMACVTVTAGSGEGIEDLELTIGATATDFAELDLKVYLDSETTGTCALSADEIAAGAIATETSVAASVTVGLTGQTLAAGESKRFIVAYDIASGAVITNTFSATIAGTALTAVGSASGQSLTSTGTTVTTDPVTTIAGSLTAQISNTAAVSYVSTGQAGVLLQKITVGVPDTSGENSTVTALRLSLNGDATTAADIAKVYVYLDVNEDGQLDAGDTLLNTGGTNFTASPTTVTFGAGQAIAAGDSLTFLLVADVAAAATESNTLGLTVAAASHIVNTGSVTAVQLLPVEIEGAATNTPVIEEAAGLNLVSVTTNRTSVKPGLTADAETGGGLVVTFSLTKSGTSAVNLSGFANTFMAGVTNVGGEFTLHSNTMPASIPAGDTQATFTATYTVAAGITSDLSIVIDGSVDAADANSGADLSVATAGTKATITVDSTPPTISSITASDGAVVGDGIDSDDTVTITFNKSMYPLEVNAGNINSYLQLPAGRSWLNNAGVFGAATWTTNNTKLVILFSAITGTDQPTVRSGDTVTVKLVDQAGNAPLAAGVIDGSFDESPPTLEQITLLNLNSLRVTFNEPLNAVTAQAAANYAITGGSTAVSVTAAVYNASNYTVTLTLTGMISEPSRTFTLAVSNVEDMAGNPIAAGQITFQQSSVQMVSAAASALTSITDPSGDVTAAATAFTLADNSSLITVVVTARDSADNLLQGVTVKLAVDGDTTIPTTSASGAATFDFSTLPKLVTTGSNGTATFNIRSNAAAGAPITSLDVKINAAGTYTLIGDLFTVEFGAAPTISAVTKTDSMWIDGLADGDVIPTDGYIKIVIGFSDVSALPSAAGRTDAATTGATISIANAFRAYINGSLANISASRSSCSGTAAVTCTLFVQTSGLGVGSHSLGLNVLDKNGTVIAGDGAYTRSWTNLVTYAGFNISRMAPTAALYNPITGYDGAGNPAPNGIQLTVQTTEPITGSVVQIYNRTGRLVRTLSMTSSNSIETGFVVIGEWDGRDESGTVVPSGSYTYVLRATAASGAIETKGKVTIWK